MKGRSGFTGVLGKPHPINARATVSKIILWVRDHRFIACRDDVLKQY